MSRRDRNPYTGRYEERHESEEQRRAGARDWERDERYRTQGQDWGQSRYGSDQDAERYGSRYPDERDYSARYLGYEARYEPQRDQPQRFPGSFGSYEEQRRVRRYEDDDTRNERERWPYGGYTGQGRYGSGRNLDSGWASESHPYAGRFAREGREANYGEHERAYGREQGGHESFGQQLREAGQQMVRKVKRAFRGPKGYKRSDDRIREDVNDRLSEQDDFDPSEIEVSVANAEVTLTGSVRSRHEKFLAEEIADDVNGVTEVHNQIRVRREEARVNLTGTETTLPGTGQSAGSSSGWNQNVTQRTTRNGA